MDQTTTKKINIVGKEVEGSTEILTPEALDFVASLHHHFNDRRIELLAARQIRQEKLDNGGKLDFLPETKEIREGDWTIAPLPQDLQDRTSRDYRSC